MTWGQRTASARSCCVINAAERDHARAPRGDGRVSRGIRVHRPRPGKSFCARTYPLALLDRNASPPSRLSGSRARRGPRKASAQVATRIMYGSCALSRVGSATPTAPTKTSSCAPSTRPTVCGHSTEYCDKAAARHTSSCSAFVTSPSARAHGRRVLQEPRVHDSQLQDVVRLLLAHLPRHQLPLCRVGKGRQGRARQQEANRRRRSSAVCPFALCPAHRNAPSVG